MEAKEENTEEILAQLRNYTKTQLELVKLRTIERVAVSGASLVSNALLFAVLAVSVLFLSVAGGFYLSQLFGSITQGFAAVGGFYVILTLVLLVVKKGLVEAPIKDKIISKLTDNHPS